MSIAFIKSLPGVLCTTFPSLLSARSHLSQTPKSFSWTVLVQCNPPCTESAGVFFSLERRIVSFNSILNYFPVCEFLKLSSTAIGCHWFLHNIPLFKNIWELLYCPFWNCCVPRSSHIRSSRFESKVFHTGLCFGNICSQIMLFLENYGNVGSENQGLQRRVVDIWGW